MVQVRQQTLIDEGGTIDLDRWLRQLPLVLEEDDRHRLLEACQLAQRAQLQQAEDAGDWARESNCFIAGLDIALILADLHVDLDCLLAGILYRAVREGRLASESVSAHLGDNVKDLIGGVLR
ncbi:MAG TPA: HD domain-containing protein, partial [Halioglobus sp.]